MLRISIPCWIQILCLSWAGSLTPFVAAAERGRYVVLDEKPKVIFYLSNSHGGSDGLQRHLDQAGYDHVKVHRIMFGFVLKLDAATGTFSERAYKASVQTGWFASFAFAPCRMRGRS